MSNGGDLISIPATAELVERPFEPRDLVLMLERPETLQYEN